jgi:hypothetical protein
MRLTVTFGSFEEWCDRARETAKKLDRGERIKPSRGINLELPLPPEPELLKLLDAEGPTKLSSRDRLHVIKMTRAKRKTDQAANANL